MNLLRVQRKILKKFGKHIGHLVETFSLDAVAASSEATAEEVCFLLTPPGYTERIGMQVEYTKRIGLQVFGNGQELMRPDARKQLARALRRRCSER